MSASLLARRRNRLVERIAAGRIDIIDGLDVVLEPLRRIDRISASLSRFFGQSREVAPMLYPLAPVGALVLVRGRHRIGSMAVGLLRVMLKSVAFARVARQVGPFVEAVARGARRHASHR
jgi:hypothetical protein